VLRLSLGAMLRLLDLLPALVRRLTHEQLTDVLSITAPLAAQMRADVEVMLHTHPTPARENAILVKTTIVAYTLTLLGPGSKMNPAVFKWLAMKAGSKQACSHDFFQVRDRHWIVPTRGLSAANALLRFARYVDWLRRWKTS